MPPDMGEHRNTLLEVEASILDQQRFAAGQHVMRVECPSIAKRATPGSFVHVQCDHSLAMRRPISIMRVDSSEGWMDLLYKEVGVGTRALARQQVGHTIKLLGPIGRAFALDESRTKPLLIGGGVGIPPVLFLAELLAGRRNSFEPLLLMGSEVPFPFELTTSVLPVAGLNTNLSTTLALTEQWGIATRLCSLRDYEGCHIGYVTDLARQWLECQSEEERRKVAVYSCGPTPMLRAVSELAAEFQLPCQISLEEFMACAVGGCAGCTVRVRTESGDAMKRVCVDGPVFEAADVCF